MKKFALVLLVLVLATTIVSMPTTVNAAATNLQIEIEGFGTPYGAYLVLNPGETKTLTFRIKNTGTTSETFFSTISPQSDQVWVSGLTANGTLPAGQEIELITTFTPTFMGTSAFQWIVSHDGESIDYDVTIEVHVFPQPNITGVSIADGSVKIDGEFLRLPVNIPLSEYAITLVDPSGIEVTTTTCDTAGTTCTFNQIVVPLPESVIGSVVFTGPNGSATYELIKTYKTYLPIVGR